MTIDEPISVSLINNSPKSVLWRGRDYKIAKVGLHHSYWDGKILYHIFSVVTSSLFLRLKLNTANLLWRLEEVSDGLLS